MSDQPTRDPKFTTEAEIKAENERRQEAFVSLVHLSAGELRAITFCYLAAGVGRALTPPAGEMLYVTKRWLIRPQDRREHDDLMRDVIRHGLAIFTSDEEDEENKNAMQRLEVIYRRGSDHLRAIVKKAADWNCVPPELLAAVLQNENSPKATTFDQTAQAAERWAQALVNHGSTGFGNVKPDTLIAVKLIFAEAYHRAIVGPGVPDEDPNDNVETDIYHASAVLRDGLNQAWSSGSRSLNQALSERYEYYPYFNGEVTAEVAIRAMGHYNGWGDGARTYGEMGMNRIQKQTLHFMPPK